MGERGYSIGIGRMPLYPIVEKLGYSEGPTFHTTQRDSMYLIQIETTDNGGSFFEHHGATLNSTPYQTLGTAIDGTDGWTDQCLERLDQGEPLTLHHYPGEHAQDIVIEGKDPHGTGNTITIRIVQVK